MPRVCCEKSLEVKSLNNRIKNAFDDVHAQEKLKQSTSKFLAEKTRGYNKRSGFSVKKFAAAFVIIAFLALTAGGVGIYYTPVCAISVDVNPSVELSVNRFDKVISVKGIDSQGQALAYSLNITNKNYNEALEAIVQCEPIANLLNSGALVSITVAGKNDRQNEKMLESISACEYAKDECISCTSAGKEEVQAAHEAEMSFGKYKAFLELQALDPSITAQEARELTMRQLKDRIEELTGSENPQNGEHDGEGEHHRHGAE